MKLFSRVEGKRTNTIIFTLVVLIILLAGVAFYFFQHATNNNVGRIQSDADRLVREVSKIIYVPTDEIPTVATISDPDKVKSQPFFADAKKGDKVIIYSKAKKAILYDPIAKKIINYSSINIGSDTTSTATLDSTKTTK